MIGAKLRPTLAAIGLGLSLILTTGSAQALSFTFTISTNLNYDENFNPLPGPGTITGIIQGLTDNLANQAASSVSVTSYSPVDPGLPPVTIALPNFYTNSFTVAGGQITNADFVGADVNTITILDLNASSINGISDGNNYFNLQNLDGFQGATYTPIAAVPELPIPLMLSLGMLVPLLARRARKFKLSTYSALTRV
jgi:hypothetical protein